MKYRLLTLLIIAVAGQCSIAARTAADIMAKAPRSVLPLLSYDTRLDMIDYFNSGMTTASANVMEGKARITAMADNEVAFETSSASLYQIALLPAGSDTIVAVVRTIMTPAPDSDVSFYTTAWQPLDNPKYFVEASIESWLTRDGMRRRYDIEDKVPFIIASYSYDPESATLTATQAFERYLSTEDFSAIKPFVKDRIIYKWNGKRFKIVK